MDNSDRNGELTAATNEQLTQKLIEVPVTTTNMVYDSLVIATYSYLEDSMHVFYIYKLFAIPLI